MRILFVSIALIFSAGASAQSTDGPFGFKASDDISQYKDCAPSDTDGMYQCSTAPKPHPEFIRYYVWHVKGIGICMVLAGTDIKSTSVQGYEIMRETDALADQVATVYGKPKNMTFYMQAVFGANLKIGPDPLSGRKGPTYMHGISSLEIPSERSPLPLTRWEPTPFLSATVSSGLSSVLPISINAGPQ